MYYSQKERGLNKSLLFNQIFEKILLNCILVHTFYRKIGSAEDFKIILTTFETSLSDSHHTSDHKVWDDWKMVPVSRWETDFLKNALGGTWPKYDVTNEYLYIRLKNYSAFFNNN